MGKSTNKAIYVWAIAAILAVLGMLGACSATTPQTSTNNVPAPINTNTPAVSNVRLCPTANQPIGDHILNFPGATTTGQIEGKLSAFFSGTIVTGLVGQPTYCLEVDSSPSSVNGTSQHLATFRVEYEDNLGVRSFTIGSIPLSGMDDSLRNGTTLYGSYTVSSNGTPSLEIVFTDNVGFIGIKSTSGNTSGQVNATIRYYNFPSWDQMLQNQIATAQNCLDGVWTVAQCLGYGPNAFDWYMGGTWYNQIPYYQQADVISSARSLANSGTQLGSISFFISEVSQ